MEVCKLNSAASVAIGDGIDILRISSFGNDASWLSPDNRVYTSFRENSGQWLGGCETGSVSHPRSQGACTFRCATNRNHTTECDIPLLSARRALTHMTWGLGPTKSRLSSHVTVLCRILNFFYLFRTGTWVVSGIITMELSNIVAPPLPRMK